jgi:ABC-type antimicrobial peptide transport system permease subunit
MLKNYLKIALRSIRKHKGYSFINIAGLAVGIASALFILLWVQDELSFDRFHANAPTLFRVEQDQKGGQGTFHVNVTPYGMGPALKAEIPEVKESSRFARGGTLLVRTSEKAFFEGRIFAVDPAFLRMFTFPLVRGPLETALDNPASLVASEDFARKYFGSEEAVGQIVTVNNAFPVTVSAVMKNVPANSVLRFDALVPMEFLRRLGIDIDAWNSNTIQTFVQLHDGAAAAAAGDKITQLVRNRTLGAIRSDPEQWKKIQTDPEARRRYESYQGPDFMVKPVPDIRLFGYFGFNRNDQGIKSVMTFSAIALFVLLIACINFMNLATARSANRAREVGLRKTVGAFRKSIAGQFYGEAVLTAVLAALASLALVVLLRPGFNNLAGKMIPLATLFGPKFLLGLAAVTLLAGLVAGCYPALFLSSFEPVKVLKGRVAGGARSSGLRKVLVVVQFGLSILLLIGMGVVSRQVDYMRSKKLGYEKDQLVYLPLRGETPRSYAAFKDLCLRDPRIQGVTATGQQPTMFSANSWGADWDGKAPNQNYLIGIASVDFDYPETMKIEMAAGRSFNKEFADDNGRTFLVNEEVPKLMGHTAADAVGKRFSFNGVDGTIVGVMENFHYQSVRNSVEPLAVVVSPRGFGFAVVRLKAGDVTASLDALEAAWQKVYPLYPFEYRFFDQDFDQMYRSDERMGSLLKIFSALAVIIACLGLFGLASFTAEQRTKEIGVRKVLGATASGIVLLLNREFVRWVLAANLLAWPVAYLVMRNWLRGFPYNPGIAWWLFLLAGAGSLIVALLTVSLQAVRAASSHPADALKYE